MTGGAAAASGAGAGPADARSRRRAGLAVLGLGGVAAVGLLLAGPMADPPAYHAFADRRTWLGVPNALDVLSNLPFLLVAVVGALRVQRWAAVVAPARWERTAAALLLIGLGATAVGSAVYHLDPTPVSLTWDRLPMALTFAAFAALFLGDRLGPAVGRGLLVPWTVLSLASVLVARGGGAPGDGDVRLYALAQYLPAAAAVLLLGLRPPRRSEAAWAWAALGAYAAAKGLEAADGAVHRATCGLVAGHALKHVAAAAAAACLVRWITSRGPGAPSPA